MSYDATNWALKQRGLKPAPRVVLFYLCDRYHPDNGCFPSQETLAIDCEISRSALNTHLDELEERGLIAREQRRERGSRRMERTRYRFAFEPDFAPKTGQKPCPETGHGDGEAVSGNPQKPSPENGESRVQNPDSNPVREPVIEPVNEREGVREGAEERSDMPGTADFEKRVIRFCKGDGFCEGEWPKWTGSTLSYISRQFAKLSPEERREAEKGRDAFLAKCRRDNVKEPMAIGNYLRDKVWLALSERDMTIAADVTAKKSGNPTAGKPEGWVAAHSPQHSAAFFRILLDGPERPELAPRNGQWFAGQLRNAWPRLARFWQESDIKGGLIVPPLDQRMSSVMRFVQAGSDEMSAWLRFFRDSGLPEPKVMTSGAYFPAGEPEAAFEEFAKKLAGERSDDAA